MGFLVGRGHLVEARRGWGHRVRDGRIQARGALQSAVRNGTNPFPVGNALPVAGQVQR